MYDLFETMYGVLYAYAYAKINNHHRAEELSQDAFLLASEKIDEVMRSNSPSGWIMNALKYIIKREHRDMTYAKKYFTPISIDDALCSTTKYDDYEFEIREAFTESEWFLVRTAFIEKIPIGDIAKLLGIEYETCKKRLQKLKKDAKLRFASA